MAKGRPSVEDRVRALAVRFAEEVTRTVRAGLAEEIADQVTDILRETDRADELRRFLSGGPGDGRIGKSPVPVTCPVPGCESPGVRAKRNFCAEHAEALTDGEKRKIREAAAGRARARR